VHLLHEAWVERVSLELLLGRGSEAPLSFDDLRERVPRLLDPRDEMDRPAHRLDSRQECPIALHVALTGLQGLTYPIRALREDRPATGATYADWGRFDLHPGRGLDQVTEPEGRAPLDFVLASAASPGGFAPRLLDRRPDEDAYRARGIDNFPQSGHLWYTDGGLLGSQPLGRVLAAGRRLHERREQGAKRVNLLVNPRSEAPAETGEWSDPDAAPTWQSGLSRGLAILSEQSIFDDLRRIEKYNSRLEWTRELLELLREHVPDSARPALREFLERVESERHELRAESGEPQASSSANGDDRPVEDLLGTALAEIAGVVGKERTEIDVISPLLLADGPDSDVESLLAGEFLGDFGGFLSKDLRASDFALGYESALAWLPEGLRRCGVEAAAVERTVAAVEDQRRYQHDEVESGSATIGDLSLRDRLQLVRLGLHTVRVLGSGAVDLRSKIPDRLGVMLDRTRSRLPRR